MTEPHVHILMGTKNGGMFLADQLASIRGQSHQDWSLWASDDGSTDGTCEALENFKAETPHHDIHLLKGPPRRVDKVALDQLQVVVADIVGAMLPYDVKCQMRYLARNVLRDVLLGRQRAFTLFVVGVGARGPHRVEDERVVRVVENLLGYGACHREVFVEAERDAHAVFQRLDLLVVGVVLFRFRRPRPRKCA